MSNIYDIEPGIYFLFIKKHFCADCGNKLLRKKEITKLSKDESDKACKEALSSDVQIGFGRTDRVAYYFVCKNCNRMYSADEMKKLHL